MNGFEPLVTVFGSLHYDILVEAPDRPRKGETVTGRSWRPKCGGKGGNQAIAAARAGAATTMIGAVGDDEFGQALLAGLARGGVVHRHVRVAPGTGSGMSVAIFDAGGDYGAVIVSGSNLLLGADDVAGAADAISRTAVLLLQNEVPEAANIAAARAVKEAGGLVVLNAAPARAMTGDLTELVDILVVNAIEAEMLSQSPIADTLSGAEEAAAALLTLCAAVVVTAGGDGVAYANRSGEAFSIQGLPVTVESTHGAGDEFVGAMGVSLATGATTRQALIGANRAAALLVSTPEALRG